MDAEILERANSWINDESIDEESRKEISQLIEQKADAELIDRFYKNLEFGTAGLRGKIGAGANRINVYNIRKASQGLADYINSQNIEAPSVVIGHDNRHFSDSFTREAACVFAANGIKTYLFPSLRPTPMVSFAIRELKTTAGVVITASHNPPDYNGYKVSWSDGCQITPPHDAGIISCVEAISSFATIKSISYEEASKTGMIEIIPDSLDQKYYDLVEGLSVGDLEANKNFGVVYSAMHGTGNLPVKEIFKRRGFENFKVVKEQELPDGDFPTVTSPNPENPSAFELCKKTADENDKLLIANDPDADRIGIFAKHNGEWKWVNGNQIGELLLYYYVEKLQEKGQLPADGYVVSTVVTSELIRKITESFGLTYHETFTGFKNIGQVVRNNELAGKGTYVFGLEESHGYMFGGDFLRDKDGVSAAMIFAEMAAELDQKGMSPHDKLDEIHSKIGFHQDSLINLVIEGKTGADTIKKIMDVFRANPPKFIGEHKVKILKDYLKDEVVNLESDEKISTIGFPASNILSYSLDDGSRITMRPSGTEPKIKFYFNLAGSDKEALEVENKKYEESFMKLVEQAKK